MASWITHSSTPHCTCHTRVPLCTQNNANTLSLCGALACAAAVTLRINATLAICPSHSSTQLNDPHAAGPCTQLQTPALVCKFDDLQGAWRARTATPLARRPPATTPMNRTVSIRPCSSYHGDCGCKSRRASHFRPLPRRFVCSRAQHGDPGYRRASNGAQSGVHPSAERDAHAMRSTSCLPPSMRWPRRARRAGAHMFHRLTLSVRGCDRACLRRHRHGAVMRAL